MVRVIKGNRELRVPETSLDTYLNDGYSIINDAGEIIKTGTKESFASIIEDNKKMLRRIRSLEEGIIQRDQTIAELNQLIDMMRVSSEGDGEDEQPEIPDEPVVIPGQTELDLEGEQPAKPARGRNAKKT